MFLRNFHSSYLYAPPDSTTGTVEEKPEILDLLNDEDEKPDKDIPVKTDEKEPDEKDEELKLDEEEKEPEEEDLELTSMVSRREILTKYPNIFKDFPYLEKAYYRERAFTEVFPTLEDAKVASDTVKTYQNLEKTVLSGDVEGILKAVKDHDQKSFSKVVNNYLGVLQKVDPPAFQHVTYSIIDRLMNTMFSEGERLSNDDLKNAALLINQFMTGTSNYRPLQPFGGQKQQQQPDDESQKLSEERKAFLTEKFESTRSDLFERSNNTIKNTIATNIDPKNVMTDWVRNRAVNEAVDEVNDLIGQDTRFQKMMDNLWEKVFSSNFSRASTDAVKSAYLNKAKTLLPAIIKKSRNEALKGLGKRVADEKEEPTRKGPISGGKAVTPQTSGKTTGGKRSGESMEAFFLRDD